MDDFARIDRVVALQGRQSASHLENADLLRMYELVPMIATFVRAYTRDNGFSADGRATEELEAVIASAAVRAARPSAGIRSEAVGPFTTVYEPGVNGFTLMELAVLHRYRTRAA
jgi:hypothetical protein